MAYCRPSTDSAVSVPAITIIHNSDFQGYVYVEIRPLIQSLGIFLESLYNNKRIAHVYILYLIGMLSPITRSRRKKKAGIWNKIYFSTTETNLQKRICISSWTNLFLKAFFLAITYLSITQVEYAIAFCIGTQKTLLNVIRIGMQVGTWMAGHCCFLLGFSALCFSLLVTACDGQSDSLRWCTYIHLRHFRLCRLCLQQRPVESSGRGCPRSKMGVLWLGINCREIRPE